MSDQYFESEIYIIFRIEDLAYNGIINKKRISNQMMILGHCFVHLKNQKLFKIFLITSNLAVHAWSIK